MSKKTNQEYRGKLENEARTILAEEFHHDVPADVPIRYFLSFKTEGRLGFLREAIFRLDTGNFGSCVMCRCEIEEEFLSKDLTTRLCFCCAASRDWGTDALRNNLSSNTDIEAYACP